MKGDHTLFEKWWGCNSIVIVATVVSVFPPGHETFAYIFFPIMSSELKMFFSRQLSFSPLLVEMSMVMSFWKPKCPD